MSGDDDIARARLAADLALVAGGDRHAFRRVYDKTSRKLFGVCLSVLGDRGAAEDALQDVYVSVWNHARRFDADRASPITWLCTIARNHAIDLRRSTDRRREHRNRLDPLELIDVPRPIDVAVADRHAARIAMDCMEALAEDQRGSIRAAFFEGLTYRELAERREVPLGTMKSWIRRGLLELRRCLDG